MWRMIGDSFYLTALHCLLYRNIDDVIKLEQAAFLSHSTRRLMSRAGMRGHFLTQ